MQTFAEFTLRQALSLNSVPQSLISAALEEIKEYRKVILRLLPFCNAFMCSYYRGLYINGMVPHSSELQCFIQRAYHIQGIVPLCNIAQTLETPSDIPNKHGRLYVLIPDVLRCFLGERVYYTSSSTIWREEN